MCYPCLHCNKCGMFSDDFAKNGAASRTALVCVDCGSNVEACSSVCPVCGGRSFRLASGVAGGKTFSAKTA